MPDDTRTDDALVARPRMTKRRAAAIAEEAANEFTKDDWLLLNDQFEALREFWRRRLSARNPNHKDTAHVHK